MNIKELPQWATSAGQRPIKLFHHPLFSWDSSPLLFIGGVHGDEPEGVRLANDLLEWLNNQVQNQDLAPWIVIPCLNPDGFSIQQRVNAHGVDLNRNYPSKNWSSEHSEARYYPGPSPGSEPEIKAVTELIQKIQPLLIVHFHSWHPCVVYSGEPAKPYAQVLAETSGYELKENIGYPTPGSLSEYGWRDHQIPVICTEEQEHSDLNETWRNFGDGLITLLRKK